AGDLPLSSGGERPAARETVAEGGGRIQAPAARRILLPVLSERPSACPFTIPPRFSESSLKRHGKRGVRRSEAAGMITLLFLSANPSDTTRLVIDREVREITQRLRATPHGAEFRIEQEWAVRVGDLQTALLRHRPDIVHFRGVAKESGEIMV